MPKLKEVTPRVRVGPGIARHNLTIFPLFAEDNIRPAEYTPVGAARGIALQLAYTHAPAVSQPLAGL